MPEIRTIGVCNGGGDCPGLNAVIRAVTRTAINNHGWKVIGITNGFNGLIWPEQCIPLTTESTHGILARGGTILGTTNRGNPFSYPVEENGKTVQRDYSARCVDNAARMGMDALVVIGGDGTLHIAHDFSKLGMRIVGVPKTIDNDLSATEVSFGFDTALHVATEAIDRLHTTGESHHRVMVVEVMGRDAGWIALHSGLAGGADIILIPEIPFTFDTLCEAIRVREAGGRNFWLVVVAEGAKVPEKGPSGRPVARPRPGQVGNTIGEVILEATKKDVRVTVLGHVQRGGSPSPFDRILATRFGYAAAELVARGGIGRMVCLRSGRIDSAPIAEAIGMRRLVDASCDHVQAARAVGISFGDRA